MLSAFLRNLRRLELLFSTTVVVFLKSECKVRHFLLSLQIFGQQISKIFSSFFAIQTQCTREQIDFKQIERANCTLKIVTISSSR
jgi:hypothetical protein